MENWHEATDGKGFGAKALFGIGFLGMFVVVATLAFIFLLIVPALLVHFLLNEIVSYFTVAEIPFPPVVYSLILVYFLKGLLTTSKE